MRAWFATVLAGAAAVMGGCSDYQRVEGAQSKPSAQTVPRLFAPTSFWNTPLPVDAALDPNSGVLVAELNALVQRVLALRRGPWLGTQNSSTPIYVVGPRIGTVRVRLDRGNAPGRAPLQRALRAVPLPANARPASGSDRHLVVWQPSTDRMWEFFGMRREGGVWHALWGGAMERVSRNPGYYTADAWPGAQSFWGATATSLPVVGGVIRLDELRRGRIDHVLALNIPDVRAREFSWPAQRTDGSSTSPTAIPEGTRYRLDPRLKLEDLELPRALMPIARAAQRYGMVVRDQSSTVALYAEDPRGSPTDPYVRLLRPWYPERLGELLARFPWDHLQALPLSLCTAHGLGRQAGGSPPGETGECRPGS